jgi:NhaP-type Na+/H+ or K+/H+ antiporter
MESVGLVVVAVAVLTFGLFSRRLQSSILTPPMMFVVLGVVIGPLGFGLVEFETEHGWFHTLAELTLVLVLFTDASRINLRLLWEQHGLPMRMLLIGLPLTIAAGTAVAGGIFPGWSIWEACALAAILAPTDAALGQAVVSSPNVPVRIRQTLNAESGLNDGIALPVVLFFISCAAAKEHSQESTEWIGFTAKQLILGPLVGFLVGRIGGGLVVWCRDRRWMNEVFTSLSSVALALMSYAIAYLIGGNGFIAAFVAGMTLGNLCEKTCMSLVEFAEVEGQLLTLLVFLVFGASMVPLVVHDFQWIYVGYALLSLTILRMLPVALSLLGTGVRGPTYTFLGWFGPRGIASILFALLVVEPMLPHSEEILAVVTVTVFLSVFLHGMTAAPFSRAYGKRVAEAGDDACEMKHVDEHPLRIRHRR